MVTDKAMRTQFARTFKLIETSKKPVLIHCTAGKDRTGVMTAILLTTLGVSKKDIYGDYLRSNAELAASNKKIFDYYTSQDVDYRIVEQDTYSIVKRLVPEGKTNTNRARLFRARRAAEGSGL
jgi:protein-tyrosine phosphatase